MIKGIKISLKSAAIGAMLTCFLLLGYHSVQGQSKYDPSQDATFSKPYIDLDEWRDKPMRHRYVHGGFTGTNTRFSFYFPPKEQFHGRFFQYITPVPDNENLSQNATGEEDKISFSIQSGAYFVETNGGGNSPAPMMGGDPLVGAYKANAAAGQYSKTVATEMYQLPRIYGYCFGGSGGAYRTVGSIENTAGVWDGAVPYVLGSPMAIPNVFAVRMHAMRILKDKFPQIIDALEPGGSGDMYAGLNEEEKAALLEVTKMGFPPQSWFGYQTMGVHAFTALYEGMQMADRKYFEDFWKVEGYLGANPPASLLKARIQQSSKIKLLISAEQAQSFGLENTFNAGQARGSADAAWQALEGKTGERPIAFQLEDKLQKVDFLGGDLIIKTGAAAGKKLALKQIVDDKVILGVVDLKVLAQLKVGDEVVVDNSNFLAAQTYHRHQVPSKEYYVWDQFKDAAGKPIFSQRPMLLGPMFTKGASGSVPTGKFAGKIILLESLWDREAFPWQADWFRSRVKENLGDSIDAHFRLWYVDRALHGDFTRQEDPTRTISYLGVLQQALRDLSAWVEKGILPPASTQYKIEDGQVVVPTIAAERKGIQPIVHLQVNGKKRAEGAVGQKLSFTASVELPPNSGKLVAAEWDFEGEGTFSIASKIKNGKIVKLKTSHTFSKPGTYFPTLRVAAQREGSAQTPFARIQNLDRVRVVVNR